MLTVLIILGVIIGLLLILFFVSFIKHNNALEKETPKFIPLGKMVDVGGHRLHVFTKGVKKQGFMLVFMAGGGTSLPVLDFKELYELLCQNYYIAVVEKSGYGFSDIGSTSRDIDTVLEETRKALSGAGVKPPYVLCPHSLSGIEALYWTQKYPDEVLGIVGLDMATPKAYEQTKISAFRLNVGKFFASIGFSRLSPALVENSLLMTNGTLTKSEKEIYKIAFYRRTATKPMIKEAKEIKNSAQKVAEGENPDKPMLLFVSDGQGTGQDESDWRAIMKEFAASGKERKCIELDCPHYIHDFAAKRIAAELPGFLKKVKPSAEE